MSSAPLKLVHAAPVGDLPPHRPLLGEVLTGSGKLDPAALHRALEAQRRMAARLGDLLRAEAGLSEEDLLDALMRQYRTGTVDLARDPPDPDLVTAAGLSFCLAHAVLPWRRTGSVTVVATAQPDRFDALRPELEAVLGPLRMVVVLEEAIRHSLGALLPEPLNDRAETRVAGPLSCRTWSGRLFRRGLVLVSVAIAGLLAVHPALALAILTTVAVAILTVMTVLKLMAATAALTRRPAPPAPAADAATLLATRLPGVSILVPLYQEADIASRLVRRLAALRYPAALLDICLVTEADDRVTRATLARTDLPPTMRVISVPEGSIRTKPRAMNYALDFCRGEIVGVLDAEDAPDPDQIADVVRLFAAAPPEVACLQGRLGFYNRGQNPLARCFAVEYATWFSVFLPGIARLGVPVPLGGTTVYFRRRVLADLGGWDAHNVTEDADLGVRLARAGYRTDLIDTVTEEEANCRPWPWVRQRSRWIKGYALTYATHMRDPARLRRDLGLRGWIGFQALFLGTLLQALLAPLLWLWWLVPLGLPHPLAGHLPVSVIAGVTGLLVAAEAVNLTLAAIALRRTGQRRLLPWILVMNAYNMLATAAAGKALAEMLHRPFFWDKTQHGLSEHGTAPAPVPD